MQGTAFASSDSFFTTVAYDGKDSLFLGWKSEENVTKIVEYKVNENSSKEIALPKEMVGKDVIGIIPDTESLAVLTYTQNDKVPLIHVLKRNSEVWHEKGKAPCLSFAKITLKKNRLVFHCERLTRRGRTHIDRKVFDLGKDRIFLSGFVRIPDFLIRYKDLQVFLEGQAPHWDKMRIRRDDNDRFVSASDFGE